MERHKLVYSYFKLGSCYVDYINSIGIITAKLMGNNSSIYLPFPDYDNAWNPDLDQPFSM